MNKWCPGTEFESRLANAILEDLKSSMTVKSNMRICLFRMPRDENGVTFFDLTEMAHWMHENVHITGVWEIVDMNGYVYTDDSKKAVVANGFVHTDGSEKVDVMYVSHEEQ